MNSLDKVAPSVYRWFERISGTWSGSEQLSPSPWSSGGVAEGHHVFTTASEGRHLIQDYSESKDGVESLAGHGVFTIDPEDGSMLWFWFDSFGFPPLEPARGTINDDALVLEKSTPRGSQRTTFALAGDKLRHRIELRAPGSEDFGALLQAELSPHREESSSSSRSMPIG